MNWLTKRKQRKEKISKLVFEQEALKKEKLEAVKNLPEDKQKQAKLAIQKEYKQTTKDIKASLKQQSDLYKRQAKKEAKLFKKILNRKVRLGFKIGIALVLVIAMIQVGPTVKDLYRAISAQDITMDSSSPEAQAAMRKGEALSQRIVDEGIVLVENEDNYLPYDTEKINVFGTSAHSIRYGGGGSGATDTSKAVNLFDALDSVGLAFNTELADFYSSIKNNGSGSSVGIIQVVQGMLGLQEDDEPNIETLTDEVLAQAKEYSDHALIVITSSGTEASDFTPEQLQLTENKLDLVKTVSENFEHVTLVINAGNALELGFIDDYSSIKSVVWVGTPGPFGMTSLANILVGQINPSGRLTDTYAYDSQSNPASVNFGDYQYNNLNKAFINYQEGIYVGYRFYETYYVNDEAGYDQAVQYPFGHGLSYTSFDWEMSDVVIDDEIVTVEVVVTNNGSVAGKDVVQLYFSAPYYEGGIEKSAIELATYAKTDLLEPGQSQTINLQYDIRDMASYDTQTEQAYVLDEGDYVIKLARNVHDIVNEYTYTLDTKVVYETNDKTGVAYENRFEYVHGETTYLSRNDWNNTWPSDDNLDYSAPQTLIDNIDKIEVDSSKEVPQFGVDNNLVLSDLKDVDRNDPLWDDFMDQFELNELIDFVSYGAYKTIEVERLGVPQTLLMDGPAGFGYFFGDIETAGYPSELVVASTWNQDLAYEFGSTIGDEANAYGIQGWYAPAMNLHRTPQGGRNFEYFSEDPVIAGTMGAQMTQGAQDKGIIVFMKHFAMNDQETNARSGIVIWSDEQAMRELYLKPFEYTVKNTDVQAAMSSFSYLGHKWAGASDDLLIGMLREEWGFEGFVSTDAYFGFMSNVNAIQSGNELMLDIISPTANGKKLKKAYQQDPNAIGNALRNSVQAILQTYLDNGTIVE